MSANLEAKKQVVEEIKSKIQASKAVVLANYNRLTVSEITALRNKFREASCEYKVYKNTLVRKAFNELGVTAFDADLSARPDASHTIVRMTCSWATTQNDIDEVDRMLSGAEQE